jgi:hypothetical protein
VDQRKARRVARRLIVPVVLVVTVAGAVGAAATSVGCNGHKPTVDAHSDGVTDTPIA